MYYVCNFRCSQILTIQSLRILGKYTSVHTRNEEYVKAIIRSVELKKFQNSKIHEWGVVFKKLKFVNGQVLVLKSFVGNNRR